jgi:hypothetical protein
MYLSAFALLAGAAVYAIAAYDRQVDYKVSTDGLNIPQFEQREIAFRHVHDAQRSLPFTAGAIIDINSDGLEELFLGGGVDQQDALFRFEAGQFVDITALSGLTKQVPDTTYGSIALDLDNNGFTDLLIARDSGIWLYSNEQGRFSGVHLELEMDVHTVPLSVAVADIDADGLFDMYVSGYIALDQVKGQTIFNQPYGGVSALFHNQGNNRFSNITAAAGLLYQHNTFQSVFIDVDSDDLLDLVVAHDTGQVRTFRSRGDKTFELMPNPTTDLFAYPMGIAVGDIDQSGQPDFYFSNVGSTTPDALVRGDLEDEQILNRRWLLFRNDGDFRFSDVAEEMKLADYEFSWGAVFEDFNLDGRQDLAVSENYIDFPTHRLEPLRLDGRFFIQNTRGEFAEVGKAAGVKNREFGISPLTADFNQDGYPDLVHVNLDGAPKAFLSHTAQDVLPANRYLKVRLPNTIDSVGARIAVTLADGSVQHKVFTVGEGLCSDQSHVQIFGLNGQPAVQVKVSYMNGQSVTRDGSFVDELLEF